MEMSYQEWQTEIAALLLDSHIPKAFIDEHLTNRPVMQKLYDDEFTATEVLTHLSEKYRAQKSKRNRERLRRALLILLTAIMLPIVCSVTYGTVDRLRPTFHP